MFQQVSGSNSANIPRKPAERRIGRSRSISPPKFHNNIPFQPPHYRGVNSFTSQPMELRISWVGVGGSGDER